MFGGFDLNLDLNKTFSDLTSNLPNISLNDILEAGGDSSADASTTLFFNPTVDAPPNSSTNSADIAEVLLSSSRFHFFLFISFFFSFSKI